MKKFILLSLLCSLTLITSAQNSPKTESTYKRFNFGVKTGFTSAIFLSTKFKIGDQKVQQIQNNYKVGFTGSIFMRYNIKSHYIQPEVGYYINRCQVYFDKNGEQQGSNPEYSTLRSEMHSIDIPLLYGYNFIKEDIYGMSFFIGPKLRYILDGQSNMKYINFNQQGIKEDFKRFNYGFTGGIAVYISKIFFDFRYEQMLNDISKGVTYDKSVTAPQYQQDLKLNRRDHILSFSLGVMF